MTVFVVYLTLILSAAFIAGAAFASPCGLTGDASTTTATRLGGKPDTRHERRSVTLTYQEICAVMSAVDAAHGEG